MSTVISRVAADRIATLTAALKQQRRLCGQLVFVLVADQASKAAAGRLGSPAGVLPVRNPGLSLTLVDYGRWVETGAMLLGVVAAALWLVPRTRTTRQIAAAALLLGGALGNLVDRAVWGTVRDFIPLGPVVVNLADLAVLAGLLLTLTHPGRGVRHTHDRPNPSHTERR